MAMPVSNRHSHFILSEKISKRTEAGFCHKGDAESFMTSNGGALPNERQQIPHFCSRVGEVGSQILLVVVVRVGMLICLRCRSAEA